MSFSKEYSRSKDELIKTIDSVALKLQNRIYSVKAFNDTSKVGWNNRKLKGGKH